MGKPDWLLAKERDDEASRGFKRCVNCANKGEPCGLTKKLGNGRPQMIMYRCKKFPHIEFHKETYACQSYEQA